MLSLVVGVGVYLAAGRPETAVLPRQGSGAGERRRTAGTDDSADTRADGAAALLEKLVHRLPSGSRSEVQALAAPDDAAAAELATLRANIRTLGITDLALRYVDENGGSPTPDQQRAFGDRAWVGDVQLTWRIRGYDVGAGRLEVGLTFLETDRGGGVRQRPR